MKKSLLAAAVLATLGAGAAQADTYNFTGEGFFTMITPTGGVLANPDYAGAPGGDVFGAQTPLSGVTMSFDTATGAGGGGMDAFLFSGTTAAASSVVMQAIGDGLGGPGPLVMGVISFDYGPTIGIPVYLVADASGIFGAIGGGLAVNDVVTGGVISSTDAAINASPYGGFVADMGAIPFAMTTLDVNQDGDIDNTCGIADSIGDGTGTGALIGGGFPLCDDGVSGVRMATAPFPGHGANFDMTSLTVTSIQTVPVPAAVWLFGSGLLGLVGVARRKAA